MVMIILSPSLLSVDFAHIADGIAELDRAKVPALHLDVMDGAFVPNISFGAPVIKCLRKETNMIFDVHLMIEEPDRYLEDFKKAGADWVTVHAESCKHLHRTVARIHELGIGIQKYPCSIGQRQIVLPSPGYEQLVHFYCFTRLLKIIP